MSECVCSCKRTTSLVFSLTADSTFVHFNVLVWWKLRVSWCYCVEYIRFHHFLIFFTFHKVVWLHSQDVVGKNDKYFIENCWIQWWKNLKIDQYLAKLLTNNVVGFFDSHCTFILIVLMGTYKIYKIWNKTVKQSVHVSQTYDRNVKWLFFVTHTHMQFVYVAVRVFDFCKNYQWLWSVVIRCWYTAVCAGSDITW